MASTSPRNRGFESSGSQCQAHPSAMACSGSNHNPPPLSSLSKIERMANMRDKGVPFFLFLWQCSSRYSNRSSLRIKIGRVEPHSELANHAYIGPGHECLHKFLDLGSSNNTKIVEQIRFGHANTAVNNGETIEGLVRNDVELMCLHKSIVILFGS